MKKVTFLLLHLNYGGLEKQVTTLANSLADKYDVTLLVLYDLLNSTSFYHLDERIKVKFIYSFGIIRGKELKQNIFNLKIFLFIKNVINDIKLLYTKYFGLKRIINKLNTDILISTRIEFAKQIKRKDIITISQEHSYINTPKYLKKCRNSFNNVKYLIVMTNKAKELYEGVFKNCNSYTKIVVIPNMIYENSDGVASKLNNNQIISIGRLEEVKDFKTLILIFSKISQKYENITLKIIGSGSQKESLEKIIKENLENRVILTGTLSEDDIKKELLKSDIFVLTSKSESFSLVLCEAMNYGLPCVAFDVDVGPREIIENNQTGFIIPDRNVYEMQNKTQELIDDIELRKKIGQKAHNSAQKYYPKNIIGKWINIFENNNN